MLSEAWRLVAVQTGLTRGGRGTACGIEAGSRGWERCLRRTSGGLTLLPPDVRCVVLGCLVWKSCLSLVGWLLPALLPVTTTCHVVEQLEGLSIQSLDNLLLMFRQGFRRSSSST